MSNDQLTEIERHLTVAQDSHDTAKNPLDRWALRMVSRSRGSREFVSRIGFAHDDLADWLGLGDLTESACAITKRQALRELLAAAENPDCPDQLSPELNRNIEQLATLIGLTPIDCMVLRFVVLLHGDAMLREASAYVGDIHRGAIPGLLAKLLDLPEADVRLALSHDGTLARSGLVTVSDEGKDTLSNRLEALSESFVDAMLSVPEDPVLLLRHSISVCTTPSLSIDDFAHVGDTLRLLKPYLASAVRNRRKGVNVFIYGMPGTGKSELARLLANEIGCALFEVTSERTNGELFDADQRLRAYRAAQGFLASRTAMILFDEVEDVFNDGDTHRGRRNTAQSRKAWMNRLLETNVVPTIWLSNQVRCMDPAFLRRFDVVMEMTIPTLQQRRRIISESCKGLIAADDTECLAKCDILAPAVVARAGSVMHAVAENIAAEERSSGVLRLIESTLTAQGHKFSSRPSNGLPRHYDVQFLNVDCDLKAIAEGMARSRSARVCLYGPPGTGKSAFGLWVAQQLDRPLIYRKASDILGMYVGEAEKNIANAFRDADKDGSVLMFDEVDSFLADRRNALRSWEVSHVNEMLTQMEHFGGVFIASTNLMQGLDQAALRRFDLKLRFGYMRSDQAWRLFQETGRSLGLATSDERLKPEIARLKFLTPGDFSTVARRHRFCPLHSDSDLLSALLAECAMKEDAKRPAIGFV